MSFYETCMRNASKLLFVIAVIIIAANVAYHLYMFIEMRAATESGSMSMSPPLSVSQMVFALMSSMGSAGLPLFGAAVIWRADRWLAGCSASAEAAE